MNVTENGVHYDNDRLLRLERVVYTDKNQVTYAVFNTIISAMNKDSLDDTNHLAMWVKRFIEVESKILCHMSYTSVRDIGKGYCSVKFSDVPDSILLDALEIGIYEDTEDNAVICEYFDGSNVHKLKTYHGIGPIEHLSSRGGEHYE